MIRGYPKVEGKIIPYYYKANHVIQTACSATEKHGSKMSVVEMRVLRWMCGKLLRDKIIKQKPSGNDRVAPIEDKLREERLRWFDMPIIDWLMQ